LIASSKLRILHLEDEMSLRDIVRTTIMVLDRNTEIHQFEGSDAAWVFAQEHGKSIDLFLLDVRVPGEVDGVGFAHRLHEMGCAGLLAFTSAYAAPDTQTVAKLDYFWLSKPVELTRMRSTLKLARTRAETRAQNAEKAEVVKQEGAEKPKEHRGEP
jgi:response regulator RpfG family c-di-GMP phosphodiesterase